MTPGQAPTHQPSDHDLAAAHFVPPPVTSATAAPVGNDIPVRQNGEQAIEWLAARYDRYQQVQVTWSVQVALVLIAPAVLTFLQPLDPSIQRWAATYATFILCLELLLDRAQDRFRREGAFVQEQFDRFLYQLPWPRASLGEPPPVNDVTLWARRGKAAATNVEQMRWRDWYPHVLGRLPLAVARLGCQHANGWWDARQRRTFAGVLRLIGSLIPAALLIRSLTYDLTVGATASTLATLAPLIVWCWREAARHTETAEARERVMQRASEVLRLAAGGAPDEVLAVEAADLQRDILEQRRRAPAFPGWLYRRLRGEYEVGMHASADAVVAEYEASGRAPCQSGVQ